MTTLELLEKYPKAAVKVREWFLEKMLDNLKKDDGVPEEFKDYVRQQGIDDERVAKILGANPRTLFDVFDANQVYINVDVFVNTDRSAKFNWSINLGNAEGYYRKKDSDLYASRTEAEKEAVNKAFEILNDKL